MLQNPSTFRCFSHVPLCNPRRRFDIRNRGKRKHKQPQKGGAGGLVADRLAQLVRFNRDGTRRTCLSRVPVLSGIQFRRVMFVRRMARKCFRAFSVPFLLN